MNRSLFKKVYEDLSRRVEVEGKKNPSWLMGYLQGLGSNTLTGYQCAALIDLLLVPLEKENELSEEEKLPVPDVSEKNFKQSLEQSLIKTLAQR